MEGLLITGGSDFHGDDKESCPFPGCASVEYRCVEEIKNVGQGPMIANP